MSAQKITYWNSRMKIAQQMKEKDASVTVIHFVCGCREIHEHSDLSNHYEHISCGFHNLTPRKDKESLVEFFA
jgi:hypothetical protein